MSDDDDTRVLPTEPVTREVGDVRVMVGPPPLDLVDDEALAALAAEVLRAGSLDAAGPALLTLLADAPAEVRAELLALLGAAPFGPPDGR